MAKSTPTSDLYDQAICIIKALPAKQNLKDVLIPLESRQSSSSSASTSSIPKFGLGPSLSAYPEDLAPIFPFHSHFASPYQRKQMKWGNGTVLLPW
jgi:hypothetical protein